MNGFIHHRGTEGTEDEEEVNRGTGEQEKEKNAEKFKDCKMQNVREEKNLEPPSRQGRQGRMKDKG
jgi:hypothetical protein